MSAFTPAMAKVLGLPANLVLVAGRGPDQDWLTGANMPAGYNPNCEGCIYNGIRVAHGGTHLEGHIKAQHPVASS